MSPDRIVLGNIVVLLLVICDDGRANAITAIDLKVVDEMKGVPLIRIPGIRFILARPARLALTGQGS
jgi:hypothetical protein